MNRSEDMSEKLVKQTIGNIFNQLADTLISGEYGQKPKVAVTALGSEHGEDEVYKAAVNSLKFGIDTTVIGSKSNESVNTEVVNSEDDAHKKMEELLDKGRVDAAVTMHYPFPIGVSTVGRIITPGNGKEMFIATTTGTSSTDKVENVFGLSIDDRLGGSIHFFIYDVIKIFILLSVLIFTISYIQSYFPPERTKKILGRIKGVPANILGALLGTITPFCSCSSIPIFIGFTSAGLPLGVTFSFLISSPLVDLASIILLASIFNWRTAIAYVVVGLLLAVVSGTIISKLKFEEYVESYVFGNSSLDLEQEELTVKERIEFSKNQVSDIIKRVWKYILIGVGIGAAIHNWIPESLITAILGQDKWYSVIIAAIAGIPMYADIFGTLPIAEALIAKGVGLGTVLTFMMGVTALSLPSMIMLKQVIKPRLLWTFIGLVSAGVIIIGYVFNAIGYMFI
jgi:uncharacterized membrane protein YraQ (UPF0718 family)